MTRIIIFTGKGGVGKTSVAAAHAIRSAEEGRRTLLVSADMAHNLGDIFYTSDTNPSENLFLLELDPFRLMTEDFPDMARALSDLLAGAGFTKGFDGSFPLPSFETLFCLLKIGQLAQSGEYERILVDCAPTGETLALLKFPELFAWYMEKFYPVGKVVTRVLAPAAKAKYHIKLPSRKAMNQIERLHQKLMELQTLLKDGAFCSVRLVCMPEKMVVEETKRSFMQLKLYGYSVDGIYINRVLSEQEDNAFLAGWRRIQRDYLEELAQVFDGYPVTRLPWYPQEIRGIEAVRKLAEELPKNHLFDIHAPIERETYETIPGGWRLRLENMPPNVSTVLRGKDLELHAGNVIRRIPLPDTLRGAKIVNCQIENSTLCVDFQLPENKEALT